MANFKGKNSYQVCYDYSQQADDYSALGRFNPIHTSRFFLHNFWSIHSYTFKFCDFSKLLFEFIMGKKCFGNYAFFSVRIDFIW